MSLRRLVQVISLVAIAIGAGLLGYGGTVMMQARDYNRSFRPEAPAPLIVGAPIGEVSIGRIGLRAVVTEGDSDAILDLGPGHLADTPWIGKPGNVVIAGHRDTSFRPLRNVRAGDVIDVRSHTTTKHYKVVSTRIVMPTDLSVLKRGKANSLTLLTCYPFGFIGHAPKRFAVRAVEIE